jgi:hypothetical protein
MNEVRGLLGHTGFSVTCRDVTQGMMRLDLASHRARLDAQTGKDLVYVDYLYALTLGIYKGPHRSILAAS